MKKKLASILGIVLIAVLSVGILAGCSGSETEADEDTTAAAETTADTDEEETADADETDTEVGDISWDVDGDTLTISGTGNMADYELRDTPWYDSAFKTVVIEDGVTSVGTFAFADLDTVTSITIPDSVTSIGDGAIWFCDALTNITVDADNPNYCSVNGALFDKDMTTLIQYPTGNPQTEYTVPDGVTSIEDYAFLSCGLTSITIPDSVTSIEGAAFEYCVALTSITIPDSVTSIGGAAFDHCMALTSITIPDSVTSIGGLAFDHCIALTDIYYTGTEEQWNEICADTSLSDTYTIHYNSTGA